MTQAAAAPDWRKRKKAATLRRIQDHAMRLFLDKGYEATTVEEIAAAAGVSHMTFFRYFPTKDDVALTDDYDPMIADLIAARPPDEPSVEKIRHALVDGLAQVYAADREAMLIRNRLVCRTPALRARLWESQDAAQQLITQALAIHPGHLETALRTRVVAAACLAAATTAVLTWEEGDGSAELPDLINQAFAALRDLNG